MSDAQPASDAVRDDAMAPAPAPLPSAARPTLLAFTVATFVSAALLFSIQPLFAKMVLPLLGGATSVWAVALVFFQSALLAGYAYAHASIRLLPLRIGGPLHVVVLLLAFVVLPIAVPSAWKEPPPGDPYLWQLGLFSVAIGLPFLALAANAPMLQAWFARSGHAHAHDPYFLYAASNLGSLLALLSYPFFLEPVFGLTQMSSIWTVGYAVLVALVALAFLVARPSFTTDDGAQLATSDGSVIMGDGSPSDRVRWVDRLTWIVLSLVPTGLLTAFTTHVTTDIASAPLLWVLPLALYLLTFVLVFRERPFIPARWMLNVHLAAIIVGFFMLAQTKYESWFVTASAGVLVFFTSAMVAHRTLYEARPSARHLTEFYLWMSFGGVCGGLLAALVAPRIFSEIFEYPILLALSMACRPGALSLRQLDSDERMRMWLYVATAALALAWLPWVLTWSGIDFSGWGTTPFVVAVIAGLVLANIGWPVRMAALAMVMCAAVIFLPSGVKRGAAERSYYGVYRIYNADEGDFRILMHGTTLHGAQRIADAQGNPVDDVTPGTYYHPASPMARTVVEVRDTLGARKGSGRFGVVGLGAGSLACYNLDEEVWKFFEIDPLVVKLASDPSNFTFLEGCLPKANIVIGDARLTLAKEPDGALDLLIVDAFSSDAVPVHLMTAEALKLYAAKTSANGVIVLHISNRYLDLEGVLGATIPLVPGLHAVLVSDDSADGSYASTTSTVVIVAKSEEALKPYRAWQDLSVEDLPKGRLRAWTDDSSEILGPLLSRMRGN